MTQDSAISSPQSGGTPTHGPSKPRRFTHFVAEEGGEENLQHPAKKQCGNTPAFAATKPEHPNTINSAEIPTTAGVAPAQPDELTQR